MASRNGFDELSEAERRNLVDCWKCNGEQKAKKCRECQGSGKTVSDLGMISDAIKLVR